MSPPDPASVAEAVGAGLGPAVTAGTAVLRAVPVPGVADEIAWLVRDDDPDHPMQAYVGAWPDGTVRVLSDDQPACPNAGHPSFRTECHLGHSPQP